MILYLLINLFIYNNFPIVFLLHAKAHLRMCILAGISALVFDIK